MSGLQKILVIKLGALGDFVQALGLMAAVRRHHSQADITLLTAAPFADFGTECGYFNHIEIDQKPKGLNVKGWLSLRKKLNDGQFDRVYDFQNNDRTALYFRLFKKKPEWVGTVRGASHRNNAPARTAGHPFDGHIQTLKLAGITDVSLDDLRWIKGDCARFNISEPYVLLVPGCAPKRPEKRWPEKRFAALAQQLFERGYTPVILGTQSEEKIAAALCETCPESIDLTDKTSLSDLVCLARNAARAIGNDTGPMHLIAATGCSSHILFSKHSDPAKHAPPVKYVHVIQKDNLYDLSLEHVLRALDL